MVPRFCSGPSAPGRGRRVLPASGAHFTVAGGAAGLVAHRQADQRRQAGEIVGEHHVHRRLGKIRHRLHDGGTDIVQVAEHPGAVKPDDLHILRHTAAHGAQDMHHLPGLGVVAAEDAVQRVVAFQDMPFEERLKRRKRRTFRQVADLKGQAQFHSRRCELRVRPEPGQDVTIRLYEDAALRFSADEKLLTLEMGPVCGAGRDLRRMKLDRLEELDLYLDGSTLEVFVNGGCATMTSRIFGADDTLALDAFAGVAEYCPMRAFEIADARENGV